MKASIVIVCSLLLNSAFSQNPIGQFQDHLDIGNPKKTGAVQYDEATQTYTLKGGGYNVWFGRDEFHYAYKK